MNICVFITNIRMNIAYICVSIMNIYRRTMPECDIISNIRVTTMYLYSCHEYSCFFHVFCSRISRILDVKLRILVLLSCVSILI